MAVSLFIHVVNWPSNGINDLQENGCCFALFGDSTAQGLELSAIHWVVCGMYNWTVLKMPIPKWRTAKYGNAFFLQRKGAF